MSRRDIPGFGFDPGFEPKPFQPQQPPPDSASIFGLISRVNQGVVSQTSKCILEQPASTQPAESAELQQAKSVAEKITMARHLPPQSVKDRAFLEAKAAVERIQKGQTLASSPTATHIKLVAQTVNPETSFRVPELPRDSSGRGPVSNVTVSVSNRNQRGQDSINAPQVAPNRSIVDYADDDEGVKMSGYGRDKALEEIDRYMARKRDVPITDTQISKTHYPESYTKEPVKRRFRESKDIEKDHYVEPQKDEHEKLLDTLRRNRIESETTQDSSRVIKVFDYGHSQNFVVDRIEKDSEEKKVERYSREKQTHTYRDDGNRYERYEIIEEDKFVDRISENISRAPSKMLRRDHSFERDIDKPSGYSTERYDDDYRRQYNEEKHSFNEDYHGRQGSLPYTKIDIPYDDDYDYRKRSATDKNNEGAKGKMHSDTGKGELEADESPINWNDSHLFDKQFDEVVEGEHDTPLYSAENLERRSSNAYSHVQGKSEEFDVRPRNNDVGFWERSDYGVNKNVTSKNSDESVHCFERVTKGTDNNGVNENDWVKEYYDFDPNYKRNKKRGEDKDVSKIDQTYDNIDLDRHYNRNAKVTDYDYEIVTRVSEDRTRVSEDRTRVNEDRTKVNEDHPQRQNKYRYEDNRNRYDKYNRDNVDREFETQSRDGRSQQQFRHRQPSEEEDHMGEKRVSEAYYHQRKIPSKAQSIHDSDRREMYDVVVGKQEEFPYFDVQEIDTSIDKFEERKPIDRFTERNRRPFESGATGNLEPDSEKITGVTSDFFCKDCNLVCVDESVFEAHLKGDLHLLTLQKKAQELFNIQAKTSRFDTDKYGNPLKALVAPTTLMTGINTSGVMVTSSQDVASDRTASEHSNTGPSRPQGPHSSNRVQVIPPKPLGPLEARSIHYTWLMLYWHTRTPAEEQLVGKYVVEYRNARETSWARAGQTKRHEFEVTGLQAGTDYLFRVYSVNGEEKSEMLESVLITTQKRRDIDRRLSDREHERGRRSRSRERIRNREQVRPRIRSGEYRRSRTPERRRRSRSPNYKRSRSRERKKSRDSSSSKSKDTEGDHKKDSDSKGENKGGQDLTKADNGSSLEPEHLKIDKVENEAPEKNESADAETTRKNEEPVVDRNVECLLYKEFHTALESPLLGLEDIYEFHDFNEKIPQHYICKLCNNKGSHKVILRHIMGTPHKLAFFKKHYPDLHESISMIAIKKQQQARLNYEGRKIEREKGRGAVKVLHMLNPVDNKGKKKYTKPVAVPAPPLEGSEELGIPPVAEQIMYLSQFDQICQAYEQTGAEDICIVGLDFIKELMHPLMAEECKYSCSLCKSLCGASTIMYHLVGRRHRIAYLKANHPQVWNDLKHRRDLKSVLVDKIRVLSKKVGRGTLVSKVAQNDRAWRRTNKKIKEVGEEGETYYEEGNQLHLDEGEPDEIEAQDGIEDEAPQEVPLQNEKKVPRGMPAIKFDIKKIEPTSTVVQPINILEQSPAKKGVFDWNKENSILQDRIQNQSIIKSTRKSKFITVYSGFFQRCPVIGMQWVTEFQKPDVKLEPWFLCFICQQRLQWKNILDHVTSTVHRLNYMKKSNFREKYSTIYTVIKTDKAHAKSLIEQYSREISELEGPPTSVEVMLELNINMEAFKGVSKIQENIKAHSVSSSHVESSLQVTAADTTLPSTVSASSDSVTSTSCASTDTAMALPQLSTSLSFPTLNPMSTTAGHSAPFIATPILDPHIPPVLPDMSVPPPGFPHFPLPTFPPPPLGSNMQTAPHLLHVPPIGFTGSGGNILNIPPPVSHHSMLPGLGLTSDASLSYSVTNTSLPGQVPTCMAPSSVFQPPAFVQSLTGFEPSSYPPYSSVNSRSEMSQPVTVTSQSYSLAAPLISAAPPFTASTDHVTNWHDPHKLPSNEYQGALPLTSETPWQHTEDSRRQVDLSSAINCVSSTRDSESRPGQINFSSQNVSSEFEDLQSRLLSDNRYHERERFENDEVGYVKDEYSYEGTYEKYRDSHGYDPERPGFDRGEKRKYESSGNSRDSRRRHYDRGSRTRHDLRSESPSRKDREVYSRRHSRSRSPENRVRNDRERDRQRSHSPYGARSTIVRYADSTEHEAPHTETYYTGQDAENELNAEQVDMLVRQYSDRHNDIDDLEDFQLAEPDISSRKGVSNDDAISWAERQVRYVGRSNKGSIPNMEVDDVEHSYRKVKTLDRKGLAVDLKIETVNDRFAVERDAYPVEIDRREKERRIDAVDRRVRERKVDIEQFPESLIESENRPRNRQDLDSDERGMEIDIDAWTDRQKNEDRWSDRCRERNFRDDDQYSSRRRDVGFGNSNRRRGLAEAEVHLRRRDREHLREEIDALLHRAAEDVIPSHVQQDFIDHYDHDRGAARDTDRNHSCDAQKYQSRDMHRGQSLATYMSDRYGARESSRDDPDINFSKGVSSEGPYLSDRCQDDVYSSRHEDRIRPIGVMRVSRERDSKSESSRYSSQAAE